MTGPALALRTLFVGGPGRSGTTVVARRIGETDHAVAFPGVELKFFTEKNGLLDLWHSLGEHYSPNRAVVAMRQFRQLVRDLVEGRFGQPGLADLAPPAGWYRIFDLFTKALEHDGHPEPVAADRFDAATRGLVAGMHRLALDRADAAPDARIFVDNTPHAVLEARFLTRLLPDAAFLHVMRDPRSIARSLQSMRWGPDRLEQCCTWVDCYCRAWAAQGPAQRADLRSVFIEDLAADPLRIGAEIGAWLEIGDVGRFFAYTDRETLNGWAARADPADLSLLGRRLGPWIEYFGYSPEAIGHRPGGPSGAATGVAASRPGPAESVAVGT